MKHIQYFNWVRDIPYSIPLTKEEPDYCCQGKYNILEKLLTSIGLEVRPRVCETTWSSLQQIPNKILSIPHDDDILHIFLEVKLNKRWYEVDPTFDKGLSSVFHINEWNGKTGTGICVKPSKIYTPKQSLQSYMEDSDFNEDIDRNKEFYIGINQWLQNTRRNINFFSLL